VEGMTYKWRLKLVMIPLLIVCLPVSFWLVFDRWPRGWSWLVFAAAAVILGLLVRPRRDKRTGAERRFGILFLVVVPMVLMIFTVAMKLFFRWLL
jgi:threonine/homoserine efflux transporter RhtA